MNSTTKSINHGRGIKVSHLVRQGSPTSRPWTNSGPWPVRNRAAQQELSGGQANKASSVFTATPHRSHYCLSSILQWLKELLCLPSLSPPIGGLGTIPVPQHSGPQPFWHQGLVSWKKIFPQTGVGVDGFVLFPCSTAGEVGPEGQAVVGYSH